MKLLNAITATLAVCSAALLPGSVSAQTGAGDHTYSTRYDSAGRAVGTIAPDPDGSGPLNRPATRTEFDIRGLPILVETGVLTSWQDDSIAPASWGSAFSVHASVESEFDVNRRKTADIARDANGVVVSYTQYSYDSRGRLECTAVRMNSSLPDYQNGSISTPACSLGDQGSGTNDYGPDRITRTVYDAAGQVLQIRRAVGTPIEIAEVSYIYTDNGQIAQVIDANGNRAELRYDEFDRQTEWVFPSKTRPTGFDDADYASVLATAGDLSTDDGDATTDDIESYAYDDNGNRTSFTKRDGSVLSYEYDALNRMTRKTVPARTGPFPLTSLQTRDVFYTYDLRGLPLRSAFDSITGQGQTNSYDGFGQMTQTSDDTSGTIRTLSYEYDDNGNRTRMTFPDAAYVRYDYDGLNRATGLRQGDTSLGTVTFNQRGLAESIDWTLDALSQHSRSYGYDDAGRLASIGFDLHGSAEDVTWTYTRNPASQIRTETQSNDSYSWDGYVNLSRAYTTNGLNQYETAGSAAFCHDRNGNLTADGSSVYLYDIENRLVEKRVQGTNNTDCEALSYSGTLEAQLRYDPLGRLFEVTGGALGTQVFFYDGNALVAEYDMAGTMLRRYVHGSNVEADDPLIWYEGDAQTDAARRYVHSDPRGSIVAVTDYTGSSIATNTYDEYGIPDTASGDDISTKGRFRYTGQAWIPELGMYYYKARIYSPTLGRFLQTDPIGYEDQFNLYAYVGNDPINGVDPTGQQSRRCPNGNCRGEAVAALEQLSETAQRNGESRSVPRDAAEALASTTALARMGTYLPDTVTVDNRGTVRTGGPNGGRFNGNQYLTVRNVSVVAGEVANLTGPAASALELVASYMERRSEGASAGGAATGAVVEVVTGDVLVTISTLAGGALGGPWGAGLGYVAGTGGDAISGLSDSAGDGAQGIVDMDIGRPGNAICLDIHCIE